MSCMFGGCGFGTPGAGAGRWRPDGRMGMGRGWSASTSLKLVSVRRRPRRATLRSLACLRTGALAVGLDVDAGFGLAFPQTTAELNSSTSNVYEASEALCGMRTCDRCRMPLMGSRCHRCNSSQRSQRCEVCNRSSYGLRTPNGSDRAMCRRCRNGLR